MQRSSLPSRRLVVIGLASAVLCTLRPSWSSATSCLPYCYQGSTAPCSVRQTVIVSDGFFECGGYDLRLESGGWIKAIGEDLSVTANNLWVEGTSSCCGIQMEEGADLSVGRLRVEVAGNLDLFGKIRANGAGGGGSIHIDATGNVTLYDNGTDGIEADGAGPEAGGGSILVEAAGAIVLYDPIHAEGSASGANSGGTIVLRAGTNIETAVDGHLSAGGRDMGAGQIRLYAGGNVVLNEHIVAEGQSPAAAGGEIEIEAAGAVQVNESIRCRGSVNAGSGDAPGGHVRVHAGCGGVAFAANGDIDVTGGTAANGNREGSVVVEATGPISLAAGAVIDSRGSAIGADAGNVSIRSGSCLAFDGASVIATGNSSSGGQGRGGTIELSGCTAELKNGFVADASGYHGGFVTIYGQKAPAPTGSAIQPVTVRLGALVKAAGTDPARNGTTTLRAHTLRAGVCSNDGSLACWVDADCTVGCQTGACAAANPDTQGAFSQFDLAVDRSQVPGFGDTCAVACQ